MVRAISALLVAGVLAVGHAGHVAGADLSRAQAIRQLSSGKPDARRSAVERLGAIGRMADSQTLAGLLGDPDEYTRQAAEASLWRIWARSGDARVDAVFQLGLAQMNSSAAESAIATFGEVIRMKPDFAEGWNKRATVLFFMGRYKESMADCDEVLKRNPHHFGALSGVGQIYARLENYEKALEYFERALAINPNMTGVAQNIMGLRRLLAEKKERAI